MSDDRTFTREEVLNSRPLLDHLRSSGIQLRGSGKTMTATRCPAKQHKKDHWCVSVDAESQIFHCHDCGHGGSIVDWLAVERGVGASTVFIELVQALSGFKGKNESQGEPINPQIIATYDYTDEKGELLYQVVRMEPKSFRQRQPDDRGGWKWTMDGATRVLYRLPKVSSATTVIVTEGEKDADNLAKLGFESTTSVAGAGKWMASYAETLRGKDVIVIPDNDEPGRKHADQIVKSLDEKANSVKLMPMPDPHKDASDYIATFKDPESARMAIQALIDRAPHAIKPLPLLTISEMERSYIDMVRNVQTRSFDLGRFLPTLGANCRKLIPGDLVAVLAATGAGKTAILQAIARATQPLATVFFELELPTETVFERFVQMEIGCYGHDVENEYREYQKPIWKAYKGLTHILLCPESGLSVERIESIVERSELKSGVRPCVVLVDYVGLIRADGSRSRYEAVSHAAEQLKVIAKRTQTIVIMASQIGRPDKERKSKAVRLNDGKDSGSLENSAGLVIGAWREDKGTLCLKILKNTKGIAGLQITCDFDGARMQIKERPPAPDQPPPPYGDN